MIFFKSPHTKHLARSSFKSSNEDYETWDCSIPIFEDGVWGGNEDEGDGHSGEAPAEMLLCMLGVGWLCLYMFGRV